MPPATPRTIFQPNGGQRLSGLVSPVAFQTQPDVVDNRFPRQQTRVLEHHAGIILNIGKWGISGQQLSAVWRFQPG
jgi:hypothetical protein